LISFLKAILLSLVRSTYRYKLFYIRSREELPYLLHSFGLFGEGAEIGVKEGDFSEFLLSKWDGEVLYSIDPW
jgi:hypothetical protein